MKKVVVGLSGGVDSSVAAYLLKKQGYDVIALFMINWHDSTGTLSGDCSWDEDLVFAKLVARQLEIPFHVVDFCEQYKKRVVEYMFSEYEKGRTPNPDILCNREIKFDLFVEASNQLGADYIATGHYCQKGEIKTNGKETIYQLFAGSDLNKDQSYFLCQLSQQQLSNVLFPVGHLLKPQVRKIARELGLATAQRKDSQGLCFIGKIDLPIFLQQRIKSKKGLVIEIPTDFKISADIEEYDNAICDQERHDILKEFSKPYSYKIEDGEIVGQHSGAQFFTIGQRKGMNIGGKMQPLFVIATDVVNNVVYVGQGNNHPGLYRKVLFIGAEDLHWIRTDLELEVGEKCKFKVRIRYRQPLQNASFYRFVEGLYISFDVPQRSITPGQFAAWYDNGELIGSGVIYY
jgi:tRNA-specific 2-thiouridylase